MVSKQCCVGSQLRQAALPYNQLQPRRRTLGIKFSRALWKSSPALALSPVGFARWANGGFPGPLATRHFPRPKGHASRRHGMFPSARVRMKASKPATPKPPRHRGGRLGRFLLPSFGLCQVIQSRACNRKELTPQSGTIGEFMLTDRATP